MKRLLSVLVMLFVGIAVFADPPSAMTVGTNSVQLVPQRPIGGAGLWVASATNTQGQVVMNSNRKFYFAVNAGTNGLTEPTHGGGEAVDGDVTWRYVRRGRRTSIVVVNDSTNTIYLSEDFAAVLNSGIRLNASGGNYFIDDGSFQGKLYAIAASTNNNVTISVR